MEPGNTRIEGTGAMTLPLFAESLIWQLGAYVLGLACAYGVFGRGDRGYR